MIFASLIHACMPVKIAEVEYPPTAPPVENDSPFTDMQSALAEIFLNQPRVVAFGEIHKLNNPMSYRSATMHFAEEILPSLPTYVKDLIFEALPDDPVIDAELAIFMERGTLGEDTPNIRTWINGSDFCGKLRVLEVAKANGITVHGGNMSMTECPDPLKIPEMHQADPERIESLVRDHTLNHVQKLLDEKKSAACFSGMRHNDYVQNPVWPWTTYGDDLYAQLGEKYAEVDLIVPELQVDHEMEANYPDWVNMIPGEGKITLINQAPRYLIVFPRTPDARVLNPDEIMNCSE